MEQSTSHGETAFFPLLPTQTFVCLQDSSHTVSQLMSFTTPALLFKPKHNVSNTNSSKKADEAGNFSTLNTEHLTSSTPPTNKYPKHNPKHKRKGVNSLILEGLMKTCCTLSSVCIQNSRNY